MPLELGLLSEELCYLQLRRDYSLQSYLCPTPVWLCAHTSAPSLGWLPNILSHWSQLCGFRLLPDLGFFPVPLLNNSLYQPEGILHFPVFCWGSTSAGAMQWGVLLAVGSIQGAQCSMYWARVCSHRVALERITAGRTAGESHVNLISVSCLTAFLLHFFRSKSFKEGIS